MKYAKFFLIITVAALVMVPAKTFAGALPEESLAKRKPEATIDLATKEGVGAVNGAWRYSDTKIVEILLWRAKHEDKMATQKSKMICPRCSNEMNHHADKLVQAITAEEATRVNERLGGLIEETHCCPACGGVESRLAE